MRYADFGGCAAGRGQGATVLSPRPASRARARGTDVSVATSVKANVLPDRLRRCEPRRRPIPFFSRPDVSRWSASSTLLSACRAIPAAPRCVSNSLYDAARGPRADTVPRVVALARTFDDGTRWNGGGVRPALPLPVASSCAPTTVSPMPQRPAHATNVPSTNAAARRAVRPLVPRVRMFGAVRPGVLAVMH